MLQLLKKIPPAANPIILSGISYLNPPLVNEESEIWFSWRSVSAAEGDTLILSLWASKLLKPEEIASEPEIICQSAWRVMEDESRLASGLTGQVSDGEGGIYYLWGEHIIAIDKNLKNRLGRVNHFEETVAAFRFTLEEEGLNSARIYPTDSGGFVVLFQCYNNNSGRTSLFMASGSHKSAQDGILTRHLILDDTEMRMYLTASADSYKVFALLPAEPYAESVVLRIFDFNGRVIKESDILSINAAASEEMFSAVSKEGIFFVCYSKPSYTEDGTSLKTVFAVSFTNQANQLIEIEILPSSYPLKLFQWHIKTEMVFLTFREQRDDACRIHICGFNPKTGVQKTMGFLDLPPVVGKYQRENFEGCVDVDFRNNELFLLYESLEECDNESGAEFAMYLTKADFHESVTFQLGKKLEKSIGRTTYLDGQNNFGAFFQPKDYMTEYNGEERLLQEVPTPVIFTF